MLNQYADIIGLPHPVSRTHGHMSLHDRAAQFAPFAALTGFEGLIDETARMTEEKLEPDEETTALLNERLGILLNCETEHPKITVTFFEQDKTKYGGSYRTVTGEVQQVLAPQQILLMRSGEKIHFQDLWMIESTLFEEKHG